MTTLWKLTTEQKFDLQFLPETEIGYHYVYLYLRDKRDKQVFRLGVTVLDLEDLVWPIQMGEPSDYEFICFMNMKNCLARWFREGLFSIELPNHE